MPHNVYKRYDKGRHTPIPYRPETIIIIIMEDQIFQKLQDIEKAMSSQKNVLTFEEVCSYTGLSRSYLYKLTCLNRIPHSKPIGKILYFNRKELEKWLLQNPTTVDEAELKTVDDSNSNMKGGAK